MMATRPAMTPRASAVVALPLRQCVEDGVSAQIPALVESEAGTWNRDHTVKLSAPMFWLYAALTRRNEHRPDVGETTQVSDAVVRSADAATFA